MADNIAFDNLTDSQQRIIMRTNLISLNTDVGRIKATLYDGDSKALPLVEQVRNIGTFIDTLRFWFRTIAVAIILQTLAFAGAAIYAVVRVLPVLEQLAKQP